MTGADNEGLVVSPLKADLGLERNTLIDRRRFALSGHGLRLLVSAVGGRVLVATSSVVRVTVLVVGIALVILLLAPFSVASLAILIELTSYRGANGVGMASFVLGD